MSTFALTNAEFAARMAARRGLARPAALKGFLSQYQVLVKHCAQTLRHSPAPTESVSRMLYGYANGDTSPTKLEELLVRTPQPRFDIVETAGALSDEQVLDMLRCFPASDLIPHRDKLVASFLRVERKLRVGLVVNVEDKSIEVDRASREDLERVAKRFGIVQTHVGSVTLFSRVCSEPNVPIQAYTDRMRCLIYDAAPAFIAKPL